MNDFYPDAEKDEFNDREDSPNQDSEFDELDLGSGKEDAKQFKEEQR